MRKKTDRFRIRWQPTSIEDGWIVTVLSLMDVPIAEFWVDDDEIDDFIELLEERKK